MRSPSGNPVGDPSTCRCPEAQSLNVFVAFRAKVLVTNPSWPSSSFKMRKTVHFGPSAIIADHSRLTAAVSLTSAGPVIGLIFASLTPDCTRPLHLHAHEMLPALLESSERVHSNSTASMVKFGCWESPMTAHTSQDLQGQQRDSSKERRAPEEERRSCALPSSQHATLAQQLATLEPTGYGRSVVRCAVKRTIACTDSAKDTCANMCPSTLVP